MLTFEPMKQALIVIDVQKDYLPGGAFPLWNTGPVTANIEAAIASARAAGVPVIQVQHIAHGPAPFFRDGTEGVEIHPPVLAAAPDAKVVVKQHADSFLRTTLQQVLDELQVSELLLCGMMTQNCVTHTAISKSAEKYKVTVLADCCTTVSEMVHLVALHALADRVTVASAADAIGTAVSAAAPPAA
ncbi:MAG: cysteine hydrolase family protein [Bryobacteraceae bacterium]|nr:cysteine hydrolase family protein [Bryobacteraceae bacterium]